ncbi:MULTISPECIES: GNAT family N-acetyltransferase [unclassified Streptosporangium]|uniref:GNAT family N-acetyltransferase n=1 Tax=unclassified Streptosporangium TaxID=2632669 RepID=UPI002E28EAD7|nr:MULTISPECIES: GNAT family N-acetyltransferase [unclassified Streptosporangium]
MHELRKLLEEVARGIFPDADGVVEFVDQPGPRDCGVIAFTAHSVVFADVDREWMRGLLPAGDVSAPLNPPFLRALEEWTGRRVDNLDLLAVAGALTGPPPLPLVEINDVDHPRIRRALQHRDGVRAWQSDGGVVLLGRGVADRWEIAIEVEDAHRGRGLGRQLARAGRHLLGAGQAVWAQIAPGNAASVRTFLGAGFLPVGAEALLTQQITASTPADPPDHRAEGLAGGALRT